MYRILVLKRGTKFVEGSVCCKGVFRMEAVLRLHKDWPRSQEYHKIQSLLIQKIETELNVYCDEGGILFNRKCNSYRPKDFRRAISEVAWCV